MGGGAETDSHWPGVGIRGSRLSGRPGMTRRGRRCPSLPADSGLRAARARGRKALRRPKDAQRARPFFVPSAHISPSNMPKRTDISSILIIGAGPIVIGQACEFDYSGTQAVKALKAEGYRIVLVKSNPATITTDPHLADPTYFT